MSFLPVLSRPRRSLPTICQDRIRLAQRQPCVCAQDRIRRLAAYQANCLLSCPCIYVCASISLSHACWGPPLSPPSPPSPSTCPSLSPPRPLAPSSPLGTRPARPQPGSALFGNRLRALTRALAQSHILPCPRAVPILARSIAAFAPFQLGESHVGDRAETVAVVSPS